MAKDDQPNYRSPPSLHAAGECGVSDGQFATLNQGLASIAA